MNEGFNPFKKEAEKIIQKAEKAEKLNSDAPKDEILDGTAEEDGYIKYNKKDTQEEIRDVLAQLKNKMKEKYSMANYEKQKDEYISLKNRFASEISLIKDIQNLNNLSEESKNKELYEKITRFNEFVQSTDYEDYLKMTQLDYELENWQNNKNAYLAKEKNRKEQGN